MKHYRFKQDLGEMMDKIFEAAQQCGNAWKDGFDQMCKDIPFPEDFMDFYPGYSYPPFNSYLDKERNLAFEFALAGFDEKDLSLSFKGDNMLFSAKAPYTEKDKEEPIRYFKRRLKLKDIEEQRFYVPQSKFKQEEVKAQFKNGLLKVIIPGKEESEEPESEKVDIKIDS
ncbi:MAG: Hsp20 family protein [Spirochaetes bacterium]|nr:Hsp20 family protein [Spirochaetota bacterium]